MNNFRNFSRKYDRSVLERTVLSKLRSAYPNLEHSIAAHRFPTLPKIILYSSAANSEESLKKYFYYELAFSHSIMLSLLHPLLKPMKSSLEELLKNWFKSKRPMRMREIVLAIFLRDSLSTHSKHNFLIVISMEWTLLFIWEVLQKVLITYLQWTLWLLTTERG